MWSHVHKRENRSPDILHQRNPPVLFTALSEGLIFSSPSQTSAPPVVKLISSRIEKRRRFIVLLLSAVQ